MDDAYSPPKAVEHIRKLVESDEVAFIFSQLGTPGNTASAKYLALKGVPTIAIVSGSNKFTNVADYPLTTTGLVSFDTEGKIYAKYLSRALPNANTPSFTRTMISARITSTPSRHSSRAISTRKWSRRLTKSPTRRLTRRWSL